MLDLNPTSVSSSKRCSQLNRIRKTLPACMVTHSRCPRGTRDFADGFRWTFAREALSLPEGYGKEWAWMSQRR